MRDWMDEVKGEEQFEMHGISYWYKMAKEDGGLEQ